MRSVAKGNYIKGRGGIKHALAHVRYLQMRGGDDRDHAIGRIRLFIDAKRDGISGAEVNERIKSMNENQVVCHRMVLSPGIDGVDMNDYTRTIMSELQRSKGQDFDYFATEHKNTEHDHSHVVILGMDKYGRQVRLNRNDFKTIRETGDRHLERHHEYTRYLDKELPKLMRDGYVRDKGDQVYECLFEDLRDKLSIEEIEGQREGSFVCELTLRRFSEDDRIERDNVIYTKHSSLKDLLDLEQKLRSGRADFLPESQYKKMWSWIGNKKQFGDDYYQRTGEAEKLQRIFDENLRRSLETDNSPPKCFRQYIFEGRGRLLEFHERYAINTQRSELQKEIELLNQSGGDDLVRRQELQEQLDWLDELSQERLEENLPIKVPTPPHIAIGNREQQDAGNHGNARTVPQEFVALGKGDERIELNTADGVHADANQPAAETARFEQIIDEIMPKLVHQHLHSLIHLRLVKGLDRSDIDRDFAKSKEDKENDREDPGRDHSR